MGYGALGSKGISEMFSLNMIRINLMDISEPPHRQA